MNENEKKRNFVFQKFQLSKSPLVGRHLDIIKRGSINNLGRQKLAQG